MSYLGDFAEDSAVSFPWDSNDGDGASKTRTTDGTIYVEKVGALASSSITAATITKANPGVVTDAAHGLEDGDEVFFYNLTEMTEVNQMIQTVANKTDNTFEIEDTSGHGAAESTGGAWVQVNAADVTDTEDYKGATGNHLVAIDTNADDYFTAAADYFVYLNAATIDSQVVNAAIAQFSIENRFKEVDLTHLMGTILSEGGAGRLAAAFIELFDVATPLLTAASAMRGTNSANTTVPDAAGTAATLHTTTDGKVEAVDAKLDSVSTHDVADIMAVLEEVLWVQSFKAFKRVPEATAMYFFASTGNDDHDGLLPSTAKLTPKTLLENGIASGDSLVILGNLDIGANEINLHQAGGLNGVNLFGLSRRKSIVRSNEIDLDLDGGSHGGCMVMGGDGSRIEDLRIRADYWDDSHHVVPFGSKLMGSPRGIRCKNVHFFSAGRWAVFHQENVDYGVKGDWTFTDCALESTSPVKLRTSHQQHRFINCQWRMNAANGNYVAGWDHIGLEVNYDGDVQLYNCTFRGLHQSLDADYREDTDEVTAIKTINDWGASSARVFLHGCDLTGVINDGASGYNHIDNSGSGEIVVDGTTKYDPDKINGTVTFTEPGQETRDDANELQTDLTNGGRLDLLIDAILADSNELQGDWADGGRLDDLLDARALEATLTAIKGAGWTDETLVAIKALLDVVTTLKNMALYRKNLTLEDG